MFEICFFMILSSQLLANAEFINEENIKPKINFLEIVDEFNAELRVIHNAQITG